MESTQARQSDTHGYGYQNPPPRYIPFPTSRPQQAIIAEKKRGVDSVGTPIKTSKLKSQKPVQQRKF
jgi:hypothetical protein